MGGVADAAKLGRQLGTAGRAVCCRWRPGEVLRRGRMWLAVASAEIPLAPAWRTRQGDGSPGEARQPRPGTRARQIAVAG